MPAEETSSPDGFMDNVGFKVSHKYDHRWVWPHVPLTLVARFEQATSLLPAYCDNCGKQVFGANCYRCVSCKLVSHKVTTQTIIALPYTIEQETKVREVFTVPKECTN